MTRDFTLEKSTKNTYRFLEVAKENEDGAELGEMCGVIYVQKTVFPGGAPAKITVTIDG